MGIRYKLNVNSHKNNFGFKNAFVSLAPYFQSSISDLIKPLSKLDSDQENLVYLKAERV